jgi:hypothetical protein
MVDLIDDLGLTFRLKNQDLSFNRRTENIVEIVRRVVIDLVNNLQTEGQTELFETHLSSRHQMDDTCTR